MYLSPAFFSNLSVRKTGESLNFFICCISIQFGSLRFPPGKEAGEREKVGV